MRLLLLGIVFTTLISLNFSGKTYHIPVSIALMDTHPVHAPVCYVKPTADMCLKASRNLDLQGKVYLPYLHNWNQVSELAFSGTILTVEWN